MEYNKTIQTMTPGDEVEGFYILKTATPKVAANGKPFLTGAISDRTGAMELKVWDYTGPLSAADEGTVVKVRGTVGEYRGTPQFTAGRIRPAAEGFSWDHRKTRHASELLRQDHAGQRQRHHSGTSHESAA